MGVKLGDVISSREIQLHDLSGKTIAVDAMNQLYMFLTGIRQPDGTPLMDSEGNITSHLSGLLYRTTKLLSNDIKPVYVFDGESPELKRQEIDRRRKVKEDARQKYEKAKREGRIEDARKYAQRTSRFTPQMIEDAKKLLTVMGVPWIQAPAEGEAQCVHLCRKGQAWAVGSQDFDALLFGAPLLIKGLSLSSRLELSIIRLEEVHESLGLTLKQLVDLAILVGTDFNPGIHGIGPKKGLKAVREGRVQELCKDAPFSLENVREVFLRHPVTDDYTIEYNRVDENAIKDFLCDKHGFSESRVKRTVNQMEDAYRRMSQQSLEKWF